MKRTVEEIMTDYKNCTENIIDILKKDDFDSLQDNMKIRQNILDKLISNDSKKEEARKIYKKLDIGRIENEVEKLMEEKTSYVKKKLKNISINKTASSAYGNVGNSAKIFSKKI
ncbi:hypothetical protein [uncultured Clostridium sp.]|uniref:hypothetical protein n=1 Tax=uncultured Clostridium sp. TaxID=59620 RepID=UPI0025EFBA70|nr:hypothetical protein [uncultured Clostridium sp.]